MPSEGACHTCSSSGCSSSHGSASSSQQQQQLQCVIPPCARQPLGLAEATEAVVIRTQVVSPVAATGAAAQAQARGCGQQAHVSLDIRGPGAGLPEVFQPNLLLPQLQAVDRSGGSFMGGGGGLGGSGGTSLGAVGAQLAAGEGEGEASEQQQQQVQEPPRKGRTTTTQVQSLAAAAATAATAGAAATSEAAATAAAAAEEAEDYIQAEFYLTPVRVWGSGVHLTPARVSVLGFRAPGCTWRR